MTAASNVPARLSIRGRLISIAGVMLVAALLPRGATASSHLTGVAVDPSGRPIAAALVRLQGTAITATTDSSGRFEITTDEEVHSRFVTASRQGYFNGGAAVIATRSDYCIELRPLPRGDNRDYRWLVHAVDPSAEESSGQPPRKACAQCHPGLALEWQGSTHAKAAVNPVFLAFFGGTAGGPGYKLDFPESNGNCATCHVPAMALNAPFASDPRDARGVERDGVFCDLCHKIDEVRNDRREGYPGILSIALRRPPEGQQLFFGPFDDVFPGDDSRHSLYAQSLYCAPCHDGTFWNVPMYSEFSEWQASSYAARGVQCQDCHMKPEGSWTRFVVEEEGGVVRDPGTIPSHRFSGIADRAFMAAAISLELESGLVGPSLEVVVKLTNRGAGHHFPTGNPMRNMILLVTALDESGRSLPLRSGERVPVWAGVGAGEAGNYAGLPGKGFAKVLADATPYENRPGQRHFTPQYPAPHWRPASIESDDRIPAGGSDVSVYRFDVPANLSGPIRVGARLVYRRAYKAWLDAKGLPLNEMELAGAVRMIGR